MPREERWVCRRRRLCQRDGGEGIGARMQAVLGETEAG